ncbi:MAG: class I SAM-dependent DNA methyltransferase, partial [Hymenobacter sp.]
MALLQQAAAADWTLVEPAIFGTLLERALDPAERHSLGAHYTPRRYVERLVLPTVIEPLRQEWAAAQAASTQLLEEGKGKKAVDEARAELLRFLHRLTSVRILDPACGSGNFLYVTLEHLKRLEGEVLTALGQLGQSGRLELGDGTTVGPRQLLGLELNPRAATIADVVLRIGYLQWHLRTYGLTQLREPLLDDYQNIQQQDAVLSHKAPVPRLDAQGQPLTRWDGKTTQSHPTTGEQVPNATARVPVVDYPNPQPTEWPEADFIIGNPPFLGHGKMKEELGDGYTVALRKAYQKQVTESSDLVMFWWYKAAKAVAEGRTKKFGFITTNSLSQNYNRRVTQPFLDGEPPVLHLTFAIPDHPWIDSADGAAVRIAMTVAERTAEGSTSGQLLVVSSELPSQDDEGWEVAFSEQEGRILADLTIGANLNLARPLKANLGMSNPGVKLHGLGFVVKPEKAASLGLGSIPGLEHYIRPYRHGLDITNRSRNRLVIDLFGLTEQQVLANFPPVYQHVFEYVKPKRDQNNRPSRKEFWWLFGETNPKLRQMIAGLARYIVTVVTTKHRVFQFLDEAILPDDALVVIASKDAYHLGVLSSRIHTVWALAAGSMLGIGDTPRYRKSRTFDPFPFPAATETQQARIRELAEALDAHRKRQQAQHTSLTLTDLYNVVEKLRAGQPLTVKEQTTHEHGLAAVVLSLHQQLDLAVAAAYGWPADLADAELLTRLVALNKARAAEEKAGVVRYLRPSYQAPGQQQAALALPAARPAATALTELAIIQP